MTTLVPGRKHPALALTQERREDYAATVGVLVAADRTVTTEECDLLRELCETLALPADAADTIVGKARRGDSNFTDVDLKRFSEPDICHAIVIDAVDITYADRVLASEEITRVGELAARVGVSQSHVDLIVRYIQAQRT